MRWNNRKVFVSPLLKGRKVGLEPIGDGVFAVYFGPLRPGWLDEVDYRIMDVKERARRGRVSGEYCTCTDSSNLLG